MSKSMVEKAGDRGRTGNILLGRRVLYQLSYTHTYFKHSSITGPLLALLFVSPYSIE